MTTVLVAGDFCVKDRMVPIINNGNYELLFPDSFINSTRVDYKVVNFECSVADPSIHSPIHKSGPTLCCRENAIDALMYAGFNCFTLANNHIYDYGEAGINGVLYKAQKGGIDTVGGGRNLHEASSILYKDLNSCRVAFINCCEHEFTIATERTGGANPLDTIQQYYSIQEAKNNADFVILIVHGGLEHLQYPSKRMIQTYRFFVDAGADVVINHHQHCINGMEIYNSKPIFYGLGNFCFDWNGKRNDKWNLGYMVKLVLSNTIRYEIIPYVQCDKTVGVHLLEDEYKNRFFADFNSLCSIIQDESMICEINHTFAIENAQRYKMLFEPYFGRAGVSMYYRGLLPSFINKKSVLTKIDCIGCESHRDALLDVLNTIKR